MGKISNKYFLSFDKINNNNYYRMAFKNQSKKVQKEIQKELPRAIVVMFEGDPKSFEIKVDNKLVFSRKKMLSFPDINELLQVVKHQAFGIPQDLENYKFKKTRLFVLPF